MDQVTFGLNQVEGLQTTWGGYPLWQYVATLLWIALSFAVAPVMDFFMTRVLKRLTAKTKTDLDDKLLEMLHGPAKVVVIFIMLRIGLGAFNWPVTLEMHLDRLCVIGIAIAVIYAVVRLVDVLLGYSKTQFFAGDAQLADMMIPVMGKLLKVFVVIIGALTTAQHLNFPVASVIAGLGIGGVAVALAAQSTLANIFGSMVILADRPFRVGDVVRIEAVEGSVETIGLRSTRIRTADGHFVTIPNKTVADAAIINISRRPSIRQLITISLTYDTPAESMKEAVGIVREILRAHPLTQDFIVNWKDYAPSSLDIFVAYWCKTTDYRQFLGALEEINVEIKQRFDAAKLEFAFPTQTIQLQAMPPKA